MRRLSFRVAIAAAALLGAAATLGAQESNFAAEAAPRPSAGWTFTPSFVYGESYDDNVLAHSTVDAPTGDNLMVVNPRGDVGFKGKRSEFQGMYDGAFLIYRDFNSLNSYDQQASGVGRWRLSKRLTLSAGNSFAALPTTEYALLVGVPFLRIGSIVDTAQTGAELTLSKRDTLLTSYNMEWVNFEDTALSPATLLDGHGWGGSAELRHQLTALLTLTSEFDFQLTTMASGKQNVNIQHGLVGLERKLSPETRIYGAFGISHLMENQFGPAQTDPSYRAGIAHQFQVGVLDVSFVQEFAPSYGIGGSMENQEISARYRMPLSRRITVHSAFAWRRDIPLAAVPPSVLGLRSWWLEASGGYAVQPWMRIEGYYTNDHQTIENPGGVFNRNRIGVQVVTSKPMRFH